MTRPRKRSLTMYICAVRGILRRDRIPRSTVTPARLGDSHKNSILSSSEPNARAGLSLGYVPNRGLRLVKSVAP